MSCPLNKDHAWTCSWRSEATKVMTIAFWNLSDSNTQLGSERFRHHLFSYSVVELKGLHYSEPGLLAT